MTLIIAAMSREGSGYEGHWKLCDDFLDCSGCKSKSRLQEFVVEWVQVLKVYICTSSRVQTRERPA